jgi:hypothetical protein
VSWWSKKKKAVFELSEDATEVLHSLAVRTGRDEGELLSDAISLLEVKINEEQAAGRGPLW